MADRLYKHALAYLARQPKSAHVSVGLPLCSPCPSFSFVSTRALSFF